MYECSQLFTNKLIDIKCTKITQTSITIIVEAFIIHTDILSQPLATLQMQINA